MSAAEEPFKIGDAAVQRRLVHHQRGRQSVRSASAARSGRHRAGSDGARASTSCRTVKTHELAVPRIAIVHTWTNTQNEGWYRIEFDRLQIPYTYISDHVMRNTPNLREKFDVIIFPPVGGSAQPIVNGMPHARRPDSVEAVGADAELRHVARPDRRHARRDGRSRASPISRGSSKRAGCSSPSRQHRRIPIDYGMTTASRSRRADSCRRAARSSTRPSQTARARSPTATTRRCRSTSTRRRCFRSRRWWRRWRWWWRRAGRRRRRWRVLRDVAALTDPDVIQAMPQARPTAASPARAPGESQMTDEQRQQQRSPFFVPPQQRPRVVLRFAPDEKNLLISGMLAGGHGAGEPRRR